MDPFLAQELSSISSTDSWALVTAHHNQVLIRQQSCSVPAEDVEKLLHETALMEHISAKLVEDPRTIRLTFHHQYLATAAAAIIQARGAIMFSTQLPARVSVDVSQNETSVEPSESLDQFYSSDDECLEASAHSEDAIPTRSISVTPSEMRSTAPESIHTLSNTENNTKSLGIVKAPLPIAAYSKARRILLPSDTDCPLLTVSMRADINFFDQSKRYVITAQFCQY